ncbi:MAG: DUF1501 domain-containing protein [Thermoguttaceae bacterium]|jgi:hypothetical protein
MNMMTRREAIRMGMLGAGGLLAAGGLPSRLLAAETVPPAPLPAKGKAKAVIQIWCDGGISQLDTFDPKPDIKEINAPPCDKAIPTNVPGIRINGMLPLLAQQADKYAIIRSMTHGEKAHENSAYIVLTGRRKGAVMYPTVGSVVSAFKGVDAGYKGLIPPFVWLTGTAGGRPATWTGFMEQRYGAWATGGDPSQTPWVVDGIVVEGITDARQVQRRDLLNGLNTLGRAMKGDDDLTAMARAKDGAYGLILGEGKKVFDLSSEKDELRDRYGRHKLGQSCLAARKLVEVGVPYVLIHAIKGKDNGGGGAGDPQSMDWDTHRKNFESMKYYLPQLDSALATLLQDLSDHGLLDRTMVWVSGEMGHTPEIAWGGEFAGGRGHYPNVFSTLVAGGGFKGGRVVGETDERAANVKQRPVYPQDLIGSMYTLLGMDLAATLPHPRGLKFPLMPAASENTPSAGLLTEIM